MRIGVRRRHVAGLRRRLLTPRPISGELKTLLDEVNVEDRGCTEKVYRGLCVATLARPGHLSHLERPNYDFAQYLAARVGGFERTFE